MKEQGITAFASEGYLTDEALQRIAGLNQVTSLKLDGSRQLSDDGLQHLAGMPQLEHLDLSEYPGGKLTDRGLEVLRHLPNLRTFTMTWQKGISDTGAANLRHCEKLEEVKQFVERTHRNYSSWKTSEIVEMNGRKWFHFEWEKPKPSDLELLVPFPEDGKPTETPDATQHHYQEYTTSFRDKLLRFVFEADVKEYPQLKDTFLKSIQTIQIKK